MHPEPFKMLVVTSRPLIDAEGREIVLLDVSEERRRIASGLKNSSVHVQVHFLPDATTGAVKDALRNGWDVVHFTGHGTPGGDLVLEDNFGVAHFLSSEQVKQLLAEKEIPLIVLSACYSELIAQDLQSARTPSFIAIDARTPIADRAAIIFAAHFYSGLAKGWNFKASFRDAQEAVALDPDVGDINLPIDEHGNTEPPWSQRFTLLGDGENALHVSIGAYNETGAQIPSIYNLPEKNLNFVGRVNEIVNIVQEFDRSKSRRVALIGTGGLGKTETAKAVGWWYMERDRVDAALWASASSDEGDYRLRDLASLLAIVIRVFGLSGREQASFEEQKKTVQELFVSRRILLVLDNWETIEPQSRRELWKFILSLPDTTRVLITSREVIPAKDGRNLELDTLPQDDATRLFLKVARNAGYLDRNPRLSKEEIGTLSAICDRLSGYPLAIEVVAGQTFSRSLSEIWADLLRVPKEVLESKDELTGEPHGVWTSLDLSYNLLPDEEKTMFQKMGALLAPATVNDIAAITKIEKAIPVITTLVRRSLVQMREGHYGLRPIVREYAQNKLAEAGLDLRELHECAAAHYDEKQTLPDALTASDHLFEVAQQYKSKETAQKFIDHVSRYYPRLVPKGLWGAARRKAEQILSVVSTVNDEEQLLVWQTELANMFIRTGEYDRAMDLSEDGLNIAKRLGDEGDIAYMLHNIGICKRHRWNNAEALSLFQQSLAISLRLNDKKAIADTLIELGALSQNNGQLTDAIDYYRQSCKIFNDLGDLHGAFTTLHNTATILQGVRDYDQALRLYQRCLDYAKKAGDKGKYMDALRNIGMIYEEQGEYTKAVDLFKQSLILAEELGNKSAIAELLLSLGMMAQYQSNYVEMREHYARCYELAEELRNKSLMARLLHNDGVVYQHEGKYSDAALRYRESIKLKDEVGDYLGTARSLNQLGNVEQLQGNLDGAAEYYRKSLKLRTEIDDKHAIANAQAQLGALEANRGNFAEARELCLQALAAHVEFGGKREIGQVLFQLGQIALASQQIKEAFIYLYQAHSIFSELQHRYMDLALNLLRQITQRVGKEQCEHWLEELLNEGNSPGLSAVDEQEAAQEYLLKLIELAEKVSNFPNLTPEQCQELQNDLATRESQARKNGQIEVADFFDVLQGLLTGRDVKDNIPNLVDPYRQVAQQTWDWLN